MHEFSLQEAASAQDAAKVAELQVKEVQSQLKAALAAQQAKQEQLTAARHELQQVNNNNGACCVMLGLCCTEWGSGSVQQQRLRRLAAEHEARSYGCSEL